MALNSMQTEEEKKKRFLQSLIPGARRGEETGKLINEAYNKGGIVSAVGMGLRRAPGDIVVGAADAVNKVLGGPVNTLFDLGRTAVTGDVAPTGAKSQIVPTPTTVTIPRIRERRGQLQADGSRLVIDQRPVVQSNVKPPTLKEIPNAQRDAELGKMNVSKNGNIVTYDIGGNTISFDATQKDGPTSLRNINQSRPVRMVERIQANENPIINGTRYFGAMPVNEESNEKKLKNMSIGELFVAGLQHQKDMADAKLASLNETQNLERDQLNSKNIIDLNKLYIDKDTNRINELNVIGQNKLRDIQGQVAQEPPIKESALKPMVIEEYDPNDLLGQTRRQRIMIPNPEGTGYIDGMPQQSFNESQEEIISKLTKMRDDKDPRLAAAEAKYKAAFGSLPY